jgi:hypothetical protein
VIDLEREVKELLEQRAEEAAHRTADRTLAPMRHRVRRRQARTVVVSGLAAALLAVGALAGARALIPTTERQPGTLPPTPPMLLEETPPLSVVASGDVRGHSWMLTAGGNKEVSCFRVEMDTGGGSSCAQNVRPHDPMESSTFTVTGFPAVLVVGAVSEEVDRVVFDADVGGQIEGKVYPTPKETKARFDVFLLIVPEERPARGLVLAMNADGQVLARHGVYATLGLFELEDAYGNVVGFIPAENPLWHEWAEPGTRATIENFESIRHVATFPLTSVWQEVRGWWDDRPPADAPDEAFLDWWASYPVRGPRPARDADLVQLASGEFRGQTWDLIAFRRWSGPCLEATFALDPWPMCSDGIPERFLLDFRVVGGPAEDRNLLIGFVSSQADRVLVDVPGGGDAEARVLAVPFDPGLKAFVVEFGGHEGDLVAVDRDHDEVWRETFRLIPQTEG